MLPYFTGLALRGGGNPHGASKNTGLGATDRQAASTAGYTDEREAFGVCFGVPTRGFKKQLSELVEPSGRIVVETLCNEPNFREPGRTLDKTPWETDSTGRLVLGYHNTNASTAHPACVRGGTLPGVPKPGGDGDLCWHVPDWAVGMVRAGNVVFLNTHNSAARAAAKEAAKAAIAH